MTNFYNHIGGIFGQANKDFQKMTDNREADLFDIEETPSAETLETPPILDTHGANNQGMRGDSSIQEVHKIVTKFIDEKFPNL